MCCQFEALKIVKHLMRAANIFLRIISWLYWQAPTMNGDNSLFDVFRNGIDPYHASHRNIGMLN